MTEQDREEASEIVKNAFGRRPDLQDGKDYVDEVRGHEQNELREQADKIRILEERIAGLKADKFTYCAYCGEEFPIDSEST